MALSDNLIAYWSLDEASGNRADSQGSNTLTDNNTVGSASGKVGSCATFNGTDESLTIADNADLSVGDLDWEIAFWFQLNGNFFGDNYAMAKWGSSGGASWLFRIYGAEPRLGVSTDGSNMTREVTGATDLSAANTWHFITLYHDSVNNLLGVTVNAGTATTLSHSTGMNDGAGDLQIGKQQTNFTQCKFDEIGFWKRVLTGAERTELYNSGAGRDYAYITGGGGGTGGNLLLLGVG